MKLKEAIEDLEYLINKVKNVHISTFNGIIKGQELIFQKAKDKLYEGISIGEFAFIANEVIASLEDAHSRLEINFNHGDQYVDVKASWIKDGVYACEDCPYLKQGDKILEIGGKSIEYIFEELKNIIPHENEYIVKTKAFNSYNKMSFLFSDIILDYLNLIEDEKVLFKIERENKVLNISCNLKEYECHQESETWLEYYIHKDRNIGVFKLDQCIFNEKYKLKLRNFFKEIHSNDIKNVVVDLRNNMGGDSRVVYEFLNYLNIEEYRDYRIDERISEEIIEVYKNLFARDDLQVGYVKAECSHYISKTNKDTNGKFEGQVYVLTSNTTFSSARTFAVLIKDNSLGTIVGEPTGGKPSSYGNVVRFKMPNSKIKFSLSTKKFIRPNENVDEDSLYPDVEVSTTIDDIIKGEDPQIKWIEERSKKIMETNKVKVMILGVDHFGTCGQHLMKNDVDDILLEEKQKEINELIDKLAKFKPTKIAVEGRKDKDTEYNLEYLKYCMKKALEKNQTIEERNEIFQIGFKLGKKLGHKRIYPVDSPLSIPMEEVLEYAEKNCSKEYEAFMSMVKKFEKEDNEIKKGKTICEYFRYTNSPKVFSNEHSNFYLFLNKIGAADNYCGADMMTEWYRRNLRIFSNIQDIAQEGDRVLVIYGVGHCKILNQLVNDFNDMELVDPLNYL